jgi:hypothetical protein
MRMVERVAQDEVRVRRANRDPGDPRRDAALRLLNVE